LSRSRGAFARSEISRSGSETGCSHSARSGIVPESIRKPRSRNGQLLEGTQSCLFAGLSRAVSNSTVARGLQANQSWRFHESSRCLRQGLDRILFHSHLQSGIEEFLYSRSDRRPTTDPRTRRYSRTFSSTLNRQSFRRRDPPPA